MAKAFGIFGPTYKIVANTSAPSGTLVELSDNSSGKAYSEYRVFNNSDNTIFVGWGATAADAQANAIDPLGAGSSRVIPLLPKSAEIIRLSQNLYFSGLATAGASDFYVCIGEGV